MTLSLGDKAEWSRLSAIADRLHREAGLRDFTMPAAEWDQFQRLVADVTRGSFFHGLARQGVTKPHFMWRHDACIRGDE